MVHHVFPKEAIPTCPIYLWKGEPAVSACHGTHIHMDVSPCFRAWSCWKEKRALGMALPVTCCGAVLPNQKHAGHHHCPSLGVPRALSKGIPPS